MRYDIELHREDLHQTLRLLGNWWETKYRCTWRADDDPEMIVARHVRPDELHSLGPVTVTRC